MKHDWIGEGLTVSITVAPQPNVKLVDVDYSPLSAQTVLPGGEVEASNAAWVTVQPDSSLLTPGKAITVKLDIAVTWHWQDQDGTQLALTRTAHFYPELICVGEIGPRLATSPGE